MDIADEIGWCTTGGDWEPSESCCCDALVVVDVLKVVEFKIDEVEAVEIDGVEFNIDEFDSVEFSVDVIGIFEFVVGVVVVVDVIGVDVFDVTLVGGLEIIVVVVEVFGTLVAVVKIVDVELMLLFRTLVLNACSPITAMLTSSSKLAFSFWETIVTSWAAKL